MGFTFLSQARYHLPIELYAKFGQIFQFLYLAASAGQDNLTQKNFVYFKANKHGPIDFLDEEP